MGKYPSKPPPRKPNGKPYRVTAPEHFSPSTGGGICGILTLGLLAVPAGVVWALVEAVQAVL